MQAPYRSSSQTVVLEQSSQMQGASLLQGAKPAPRVFACAGHSLRSNEPLIPAEHSKDLKTVIEIIKKAKLLKVQSMSQPHCQASFCLSVHRDFMSRSSDDWIDSTDKLISDYIAKKQVWVASKTTIDHVKGEIESFQRSLEESVNELREKILVDSFTKMPIERPVWAGLPDLTGRTSSYVLEEGNYLYIYELWRRQVAGNFYSPLDFEESKRIHEMSLNPVPHPYAVEMIRLAKELFSVESADEAQKLDMISVKSPLKVTFPCFQQLSDQVVISVGSEPQVVVLTEKQKIIRDARLFDIQLEMNRSVVEERRAEETARQSKLFDQMEKLVREKVTESREKLERYKVDLDARIKSLQISSDERVALQEMRAKGLEVKLASAAENHNGEISALKEELDQLQSRYESEISRLRGHVAHEQKINLAQFTEFTHQLEGLDRVYKSGISAARVKLSAKEELFDVKISGVEQARQIAENLATCKIQGLEKLNAEQSATIEKQTSLVQELEKTVQGHEKRIQQNAEAIRNAMPEPGKKKKWYKIF